VHCINFPAYLPPGGRLFLRTSIVRHKKFVKQ
jgi:hypothetical protein